MEILQHKKKPLKSLKTSKAFKLMAQEEGFEPPTSRLTAGCSTTELLLNRSANDFKTLA